MLRRMDFRAGYLKAYLEHARDFVERIVGIRPDVLQSPGSIALVDGRLLD